MDQRGDIFPETGGVLWEGPAFVCPVGFVDAVGGGPAALAGFPAGRGAHGCDASLLVHGAIEVVVPVGANGELCKLEVGEDHLFSSYNSEVVWGRDFE